MKLKLPAKAYFSSLKLLYTFGLVLAVVGIVVWLTKPIGPAEINKKQLVKLNREINEAVVKEGFKPVYTQYLQKYPSGSLLGHAVDHFFGDILYHQYGLNGITYCQSRYTFGCQHSHIFSEVAAKGEVGVEAVVNLCQTLTADQNNACRHALGHTLLELSGDDQLFTVLSRCGEIDQAIRPHGCVGGALMQYFFPGLYAVTSDTKQRRNFDPDHPFDVCLDSPDDFQPVCVYSLVEWWSQVLNRDYQTISGYCAALQDVNLQKSCFAAMGSDLAYTSAYSLGEVSSACGLIDNSSQQSWCRAGAGWLFLNNQRLPESELNRICETDKLCYQSTAEFLEIYSDFREQLP